MSAAERAPEGYGEGDRLPVIINPRREWKRQADAERYERYASHGKIKAIRAEIVRKLAEAGRPLIGEEDDPEWRRWRAGTVAELYESEFRLQQSVSTSEGLEDAELENLGPAPDAEDLS